MSWHFSLQNTDLCRSLEKEAKSNTKKIQMTRKMLVCAATQMTESIKHLHWHIMIWFYCNWNLLWHNHVIFSSEKLTLNIQGRWHWEREAAPSLTKHWPHPGMVPRLQKWQHSKEAALGQTHRTAQETQPVMLYAREAPSLAGPRWHRYSPTRTLSLRGKHRHIK